MLRKSKFLQKQKGIKYSYYHVQSKHHQQKDGAAKNLEMIFSTEKTGFRSCRNETILILLLET